MFQAGLQFPLAAHTSASDSASGWQGALYDFINLLTYLLTYLSVSMALSWLPRNPCKCAAYTSNILELEKCKKYYRVLVINTFVYNTWIAHTNLLAWMKVNTVLDHYKWAEIRQLPYVTEGVTLIPDSPSKNRGKDKTGWARYNNWGFNPPLIPRQHVRKQLLNSLHTRHCIAITCVY